MKISITEQSGLTSQRLFQSLDRMVKRDYPRAIKLALGHYLNLIRVESIKEIIPEGTGVPRFMDWKYRRAQYIMQATNPAKLTSRSGRLVAGLAEGKDVPFQNLDNKVSKTDPAIFKSLSGKITGGGKGRKSSLETYEAQWSPYIRSGSVMLTNFKMMGHNIDISKAKKMLAIRFRHEEGLRGNRRPFLSTAHQRNSLRLNQLVTMELRSLNAKHKLF